MDYKLQPLTIQQTNWAAYIPMYSELFDCSPTRVLDDAGIKLDKPHSLTASMRHHYKGDINKHATFSFVGTASSDMLIELANCTDIDVISKESTEERGIYIFIASATLSTWKQATDNLTTCSKHTRLMGERFVSFIKMAGYIL